MLLNLKDIIQHCKIIKSLHKNIHNLMNYQGNTQLIIILHSFSTWFVWYLIPCVVRAA